MKFTERLKMDVYGNVIVPNLKRKYNEAFDSPERKLNGESKIIMNGKSEVRRNVKSKEQHDTFKEYIVESIVDYELMKGKQMFCVKWKGWSAKSNTWEPAENLNCPDVLRKFLDDYIKPSVILNIMKELDISYPVSDNVLLEYLPKEGFSKLPEIEKLQIQLLLIASTNKSTKNVNKSKKIVLQYFLALKRETQLKALLEWQKAISKVENRVPLRIENNVDLTFPPKDFIYCDQYKPADGIVIPEDPPIGCACEKCCYFSKDCCGNHAGPFPYKGANRMSLKPGIPVYECNKNCKCGIDCRNRVVQRGRKTPLCIFRTSNGCGWGVKALRTIQRGEFVCQYVGEVITFDEAEKRGKTYDCNGHTYLFDLDFNSQDFPYTVDAAKYGNVSHFINHSCEPNLGVWAVWINCLDPNLPNLALFATKTIEKNEEITFDYMSQCSAGRERDSRPSADGGQSKVLCKCFKKSCRQYLF